MTREEQIDVASLNWWMNEVNQNGDAEMAFKAGAMWADAHHRWISVDDALPEEDGKYLFFSTRGGMQCAYYYKGLTMGSTITHWMPLPPTEGIRENQGKISPNRIIGTEEHIKIALDVMEKGGEQ